MNQDPVTHPKGAPEPSVEPTKDKDAVATEVETTITTETTTIPSDEPATAPLPPISDPTVVFEPVKTPLITPKKKNPFVKFLIFLFILILLAAGAGLVWYYVYHNVPEKVAYDAVHGFLQEKNVQSWGVLSTTVINDGGTNYALTLRSEAASQGLAGSSTINLSLVPIDANGSSLTDQSHDVEIGNVVMSDGVIYLRLSNFADALEQLLSSNSADISELEGAQTILQRIADSVDGEWWRISVPEILDTLSEDLGDLQPQKELYTCMINVANRDVKGSLAQIYTDHRFIGVERTSGDVLPFGRSSYNVQLDYDRMADFVNAVPQSSLANEVYNCFNKYLSSTGSSKTPLSADSVDTITADDLRAEFSDQTKITMGVENLSHRLTGLTVAYTDGESDSPANTTSLSLKFEYDSVAITAPEKYRPATELVDDILTIIVEEALKETCATPVYDETTGLWICDDDGASSGAIGDGYINWNT